jgi:hypothetical protein
MKRIKQIAGALALNSFAAICVHVGDGIFVSHTLTGATTVSDALNFVVGYWATPIFCWSTLVYFVCLKLEQWTNNTNNSF